MSDALPYEELGDKKKSDHVRPILVISIAETVLNDVIVFRFGCYDWPLHTSPRQAE